MQQHGVNYENNGIVNIGHYDKFSGNGDSSKCGWSTVGKRSELQTHDTPYQ
ncbi:MAG: hypothetical protein OFPII_22610 [Osedax symbiont Rs1]|nr:MAG: hypothetical protein OFPII_22610 [Osedax symbiont Rs1]